MGARAWLAALLAVGLLAPPAPARAGDEPPADAPASAGEAASPDAPASAGEAAPPDAPGSPAVVAEAAETPDSGDAGDPWEPFNRKIFSFNDFVSRWALEPIGRGWKWLAPTFVRDAISRVFTNARTPVIAVNDLLQGKPKAAGIDLTRLILNSTIGLAGLLDPATAAGLPQHDEDFGQTLGVWGLPNGPYLMLPIFGPSTVRDGTGRLVDSAATAYGYFIPLWASVAIRSGETFNQFSYSAEDIASERAAAFDWYAAVRNAYLSHREAMVRDEAQDGKPAANEAEEEELYLPDEDFEE